VLTIEQPQTELNEIQQVVRGMQGAVPVTMIRNWQPVIEKI
jgi:hypothetical protein